MASFQNHYKTLGIPPNADAASIKAAYRKLARNAHPDLNPDDSSATERLKAINAAYDVLGNPDKRASYDRQYQSIQAKADQINPNKTPASPSSPPASGSPSSAETKARQNEDPTPPPNNAPTSNEASPSSEETTPRWRFERFLNKKAHAKSSPSAKSPKPSSGKDGLGWFKQAASPTPSVTPHRGDDVRVTTYLSDKEALQGVKKTVHVKHKDPCPECANTGRVNNKPCPRCHGDKQILTTRKLEVKIPAGVQHGSKIRVAGEGGHGLFGGDNGDLYLLIHLKNQSTQPTDPPSSATDSSNPSPPVTPENNTEAPFRIEGMMVRSTVRVPLVDAVLGGTVTVTTVHGPMQVTIPAGTNSGQVLRLKGLGIADPNHTNPNTPAPKGDHLATVWVDLPRSWQQNHHLSDADRIVLERLRGK
ncbi:MAG: DnaJ C-terminal domain-containing protein [Vampirovibrionales bacterium]